MNFLETIFPFVGLVFGLGVLCFWFFLLFKLEREKQRKFLRLYDEMYIYFKNINKGE